jgi:hypothetical protein
MFQILDQMIGELNKRFAENQLSLAACSALIPSSKLFLRFDAIKPLALQFQHVGINVDMIKTQLVIVQDMLKRTDSITSTQDLLQYLLPMKCAFPDFVKFIQLVLTIPVSSAQAERTFSCMKRVKSYLRSTMSEKRLNNLCLLSIEREVADKVLMHMSVLVDKFARMKSRRLNFILK